MVADQRDRREQVGDDRRRPEAHLAPRQHVAHERGRHHGQKDDHPDHPQQLARRLVGAVIEPAEEVDVDHHEEGGGAVHVHIAQQPAVVHVAHDVLDGIERVVDMRRVMHREHDAGRDHDHEHDPGERTEIPPVGKILRRRIFVQLVIEEGEHRQAIVDPPDDAVVHPLGCHVQPILSTLLSRNS